jgi:hypothetical protein
MDNFFANISTRWPAGRADYHWHVLLSNDEVGERLTVPYRDLTVQPGLAQVAPEWCHITVWHDAPADEVSEYVINQIIRHVRDQCSQVRPFAARVRRPEVWSAGVVCPVHPGLAFRQLWTLVRGATTQHTGVSWSQGPLSYYPHVSLAYTTGRRNEGALREWLSDSDLPEWEVPVRALTLVKQKHNDRAITWDVVDVIPLGGRR